MLAVNYYDHDQLNWHERDLEIFSNTYKPSPLRTSITLYTVTVALYLYHGRPEACHFKDSNTVCQDPTTTFTGPLPLIYANFSVRGYQMEEDKSQQGHPLRSFVILVTVQDLNSCEGR